jgi:protein-S-isoprenylcysteine O-methyltransferase Ste14
MAMCSLGQGIGVGLWLGSPLVLLYVLIGGLLWNIIARPWEERDMEARFGDAFRHYRAQVRCWIPRWKAYSPLQSTLERS